MRDIHASKGKRYPYSLGRVFVRAHIRPPLHFALSVGTFRTYVRTYLSPLPHLGSKEQYGLVCERGKMRFLVHGILYHGALAMSTPWGFRP